MTQDDLKVLMKHNYLQYASYVILDRAIPDVIDGLKPVQRRILHTLFKMDDGKLHKVANVVGQTMAYHPHGDAPITDALVNIANKGYLIDRQGNFGNLLTGDPAAAARYIEAKLSSLAKETLFNPDITETVPSYDGRNKEPTRLPAKIPLLLLLGTEGIAVGMSTKILPHNFVELLEAEINYLEKKDFEIYPDFLGGGIMDVSEYDRGKGKVRVRAKIEIPDPKTILIKEICPGTTTESVISSIDDAAKKGKIKIDSINDYTSHTAEIEIKLIRGQYAASILDALYAFTDCEVTINTQAIVIKDNLPWDTDVHEILKTHADFLKETLKQELLLEKNRLLEKIFQKTLEQIFIENRLYKKIEQITTYEKIHETIKASLVPFHKQLYRKPEHEDREKLLNIPIRRISRFDIEKNQGDILAAEEKLAEVEKSLANMTRFTVRYLKDLIKKYGKLFPRKTHIKSIEQVDVKAVSKKKIEVGIDLKSGFIGTKVKGDQTITCTNLDKLQIFFSDGTFKVINPPEKDYIPSKGSKIIWAGIADKKTTLRVLYSELDSGYLYAKRFIIKKFIIGKSYEFAPPKSKIYVITEHKGASVRIDFKPKSKQKVNKMTYDLDEVAIKGVSAKGIRVANKEVKKVTLAINETSNS